MRPAISVSAICLAAMLVLASPAATAQAQAPAGWPAKPITIVVPTTPSSASDIWARLYSQAISENTGWKFLIDYKPGAGATLGAGFVAKAAPDGHTLLIVSSTLTTAPIVYKNLSFDPVKSFAPVSMTSNGSSMLLVHPSINVSTYKEYVAYAKANPGKVSFGNSGVGSTYHLSGIVFHKAIGAEVTFIPYKGAGDVSTANLAGEIQASFGSLSVNLPLVKTGKLRALGVTTTRRSVMLPDMPTLQDLCGCEFEHNAWTGVVSPAGTPPAIVNALSREFIKASTTNPEVAKRLGASGMESGGSTPEFISRIISNETEKWRRVVKENNLVIQAE